METGQDTPGCALPPAGECSTKRDTLADAVATTCPRPPRAADRTVLGRLTAGGSEGNERLTVWTGVVLVVLLAVIGVTLLHLRTTLLWVHLFVGLLLLGPVLVKLASTGYRFVRYYTHNPRYRRKGPPPACLRMIAPMVVLTTVIVFASGVALLLVGPSSRGTLLPVHKVSFIVWLAFTGVHVLGHLPEVQRTLSGGRSYAGPCSPGRRAGVGRTPHGARVRQRSARPPRGARRTRLTLGRGTRAGAGPGAGADPPVRPLVELPPCLPRPLMALGRATSQPPRLLRSPTAYPVGCAGVERGAATRDWLLDGQGFTQRTRPLMELLTRPLVRACPTWAH